MQKSKQPLIIKNRKIFVNSKNGQATIILPKKKFLNLFEDVPKEVEVEIKKIRW